MGVKCCSAGLSLSLMKLSTTQHAGPRPAWPAQEEEDEDERVQIVGVTELLYELEELARHARSQAASSPGSEVLLLLLAQSAS